MADESKIDSDLFTQIGFSTPIKFLVIYSEDNEKIGSYEFKATVFYEDYPAATISTTFLVEILKGTPATKEDNASEIFEANAPTRDDTNDF